MIAANTHVHADHITGSGKLKEHISGCQSILGDKSGAKADIYVAHGDTIAVGKIQLEARSTPGHTNGESNCLSCEISLWLECLAQGREILGSSPSHSESPT